MNTSRDSRARTPIDLATTLVCAYVANNPTPAKQLPELIEQMFQSLTALGRGRIAGQAAAVKAPTVAMIAASIRPDALISFEDGKRYKALRRHLTLRGLTPDAYRRKWGLPVDYPMVCAHYSARRSEIAREVGLGTRAAA